MKPRIEKKLSKKLSAILSGASGFEDIWVDDELELHTIHYDWHGEGANGCLTSKQKRENFQQRVSVNNMPSVGGHADYWGEATDIHSVFKAAQELVSWECLDYSKPENDHPDFDCDIGWPILTKRLTGKNVIALCKRYIKEKSSK